jgi:hypothetical protein
MSSSREEWTAALAAWDALTHPEQVMAIAYIASGDAQLVIEAAASIRPEARTAPRPAARDVGQANTAIAGLDGRQCREVLSVLAANMPASVLTGIAEVTRG